METTEQTTISEKIINGLKKSAVELEEFRVQVALGKAEAHDAYEESLKKLNNYIHEANLRMGNTKDRAKGKLKQLKTLLESLQAELASGIAETKDAFVAQERRINKTLNETEAHILKNGTIDLYYAELQMEIESFRIKLDMLKLQFELNKSGVQHEFEERKKDFSKKLIDIKKQLMNKEAEAETTWEHFRNEISVAYSHLKKAFAG